MQLTRPTAEIFLPDDLPVERALARTTHLAIAAHPDDIEIMALPGILECFQRVDKWFCGVVVTDGSGSARAGLYRDYNNAEMRTVRRKEQKKAAVVGEYTAQVLLDYSSDAAKDPADPSPTNDITALLKATQPQVVYTHNLADRHDTHVAVALRVVEAIRRLPETQRPQHLLGCEAWRSLDWMAQADKVILDCSAHENLQAALVGVFDSQIGGGKRYDLAAAGRRRANATYQQSHRADQVSGMVLAMDLTPLVTNTGTNIQSYVQAHITRFAQDVMERLARYT
ncbi:MAG: PIG-L deacetylase family protein [Chloroflexota bacterium]